MDDKHSVLGLVSRGSGKANIDGPLPAPVEARKRATVQPDLPGGDHRNYHGSKFSNKNWNHQQRYPGPTESTGLPAPQTLAQAFIHPQSDLAHASQQLQLDPSQSHKQHAHHPHQSQSLSQSQSQSHQGQHQLVPPSPSPLQQDLHSHSHSHSNSHSHTHLAQTHQPYRNPSQPPRLPPLAVSLSLSPFDPFTTCDGENYFLSAAASSAPATSDAVLSIPRLPVQTDDIVSPISDTRSSTPNFRSLDRGDEPAARSPAAQPLTRFTALNRQPTANSSAGASVLDDRDFELSLRTANIAEPHSTSPSRSFFAAVTSAVAHDVAHVTDERSDDWFRYTARESTISKYTNNSHPEAHHMMAAVEPSVREQHQQGDGTSATTSSFTPLPPIRRTSTFNLMRKKGLVDDDGDTVPSPIEKDIPPIPPIPSGAAETAQQTSNGQLSAGQGVIHSSPHSSVQLNSQPNLNLNPSPYGQSQPAMPQQPNGPVPAAGPPSQPGMPQPPIMQMHPHQMAMGRGGPSGQQVAPGHMTVDGRGQTVISLPGGRKWTAQESHLAEPLNPSNRNRPTNGPQSYAAYDKETEGEGPLPPHLGGSPSQLVTRPRNASNPVPPTAATRYPALFPNPPQGFPPGQGQVPLRQHPLLHSQNGGNIRPRASFDDRSLSKETMGVHVDQIPIPTEDDKGRRGSGQLFKLGHRRNSSSVEQGSSDAPPDKKKMNIFQSVANMAHSQPKPKSNLGLTKPTTFDDSDQVSLQNPRDNMPPKKRLSELKGMIKGVGGAKEGGKDDQPVMVETIYEARQSMQSPPANITAFPGIQGAQRPSVSFGPPAQSGPFGSQGQAYPPEPQGSMQPRMQPLPSQMGQPMGHPMATGPPPFAGVGRASTAGPQPGPIQQVKSEESGKKSSGGGFLGGLFNKQGNKTKETKPQPPQQTPPSSQRPMQPPTQATYVSFRPGQNGQPLGPHPMFAGQPQVQRSPPGQSPSPPLFQDPTQPPPSLQKAQMITIRRPSGLTVSSTQSNQRPGMPSPQASQSTFKQQAGPSPLGHRSSQMDLQNKNGVISSQTSPQLSDDSPLEGPAGVNSAVMPRSSPNRKPVGSGSSRDVTPTVLASAMKPERTASPSPRPDEQRAPSQLSYVQQSSLRESLGGANDTRQPSLPSPEPSPVPSQSNHSSSPRLQGGQFARDSPGPRESGQGLGLFPNSLNPAGQMNTSGPNGGPNGPAWGPNGVRPSVPPLTSPSAAARTQPSHNPSSPVPSVDQGKLSRFFGAYDGGKPAAQPQANKEKSAASKFLGAFKRSSKQSETTSSQSSQSRPQTSPHIPQQVMRPGVPSPAGPGGIPGPGAVQGPPGAPMGQVRIPPIQPGQGRGSIPTQISPQQMQAGRGQLAQMPPQAQGMPMPMQTQAGRGQFPPGMMIMQGGRGQPPQVMLAGPGSVPPHMQRPAAPGKQGNEPQYDQVPIPRGYEAVHGYGPGGMLAYSPYNAGRPGLPSVQYAPFPPAGQPGFPQRQLDPRMMQPGQPGLPLGTAPGAPQTLPQGVPNNTPYQSTPQQSVPQGSRQIPSPVPPQFQAMIAQGQPAPQQFQQQQPLYPSGQMLPPGQGQIPAPVAQNPQGQQIQPQGQPFQQGPSSGPQVQNLNPTGTPQNRQSPVSNQQPNLTFNPVPQSGIRPVSISGSATSSSTSSSQSLHIPPVVAQSQPPQSVHSNSTHQASPVIQTSDPSTQVSSQEASRPPTQSPTAASGLLRSPDAARLTSRMSMSRNASYSRDLSFGQEKPADRTLTVSPEPPGRYHGPIHQVSEQTLGVDIERANSHVRHASEDIYDATPRLDSTPDATTQENGNTKYAGSEKGRGLTNPATAASGVEASGAGSTTATVVAEDNMSFLDGPDSETDEPTPAATTVTAPTLGEEKAKESAANVSPPQQQSTPKMMNLEPEEKILVDLPVELAAVKDDDDGIPMMSATSYPGQEWNPYGAGEFGDWE
ncbi:hypothetical protein F4679DRAFT_537950 [Xylaria curta]|nr:hypothetical protein F4679DRAFT_537950 [Xylaria curta]